ncbi:thioredoxin [Marchantia polymorpha subsp. ruderalis]|uniref:Thioredoxin domain-containing protein n=2 Tax=Marchantia polymorpha TaxID=3197 RepID=A0AAF6AXH2_MARPO|nr:hypothetical protein MARPO_0022s0050 [Marchantia polymorpha]BBN04456.1 hypothetical protein Mp_3g04790 [Marchantia polymorpha subsp. ruderalis]|eukprot:PTQ43946.1 hypothetical protein MARPO_0022s0050 [Marchantia polymorpha]
MAHAAICGLGAAVAAAPAGSNLGARKVVTASNGGQSLVPVVGLVNRVPDFHVKAMRWQQRRNCVSGVSGRQRRWQAPVAALKALTVNEADFEEEVLKSNIPVLVEYWATWCGPCRLMSMVMDWAAQEYEGKLKCVKIETDPNEALKEKYKVYGLPTIMLFVNGQEVPGSRREGALPKDKLKSLVAEILPSLANTN